MSIYQHSYKPKIITKPFIVSENGYKEYSRTIINFYESDFRENHGNNGNGNEKNINENES